jgi:subtilisin family serine protease
MARSVLCSLLLTSFMVLFPGPVGAAGEERVILHSTGSRDQMRRSVEALGGTVTQVFQNVNALAATVPSGGLATLSGIAGFKVAKDAQQSVPAPTHPASATETLPDITATPGGGPGAADFKFNNTLIRADVVQAGGVTGSGTIVAVIDTGVANAPSVTSLYGRVIGGESFTTTDTFSATSTKNHQHGTRVGSMIAGKADPGFLADSCLAQAVQRHAPAGSWYNATVPLADGTPALVTFVPLRGVAPDAKLYAFKVLDAGGWGSDSWIMGGVDRAITLKRNFLAGQPSVPVAGDGTEENPYKYDSLDISVVNMSLGGPTLDPGLGLYNDLVREALEVGVVVAVAAGNSGPSGLSTGAPSTAIGTLSVAAASTPTHLRIAESFWACDPEVGAVLWPDNHLRTALFSSRGPTPDGRTGISVSSAGDLNFLQGRTGGFGFGSGTSFATPTVAGAAALLHAGAPRATATQVRNAIEEGANPRLLGDNSTAFDQGFGFLDVARSLQLLKGGRVSNNLRHTPSGGDEVAHNLEAVGLDVRRLEGGKSFSGHTGPLLPGERHELLVQVGKEIGSLRVDVDDVSLARPAQQNQYWGDDVILVVHSAKTTAAGDYRLWEYIRSPQRYQVGDLDTGIMRITFLGSDSNAGKAGLGFHVTAVAKPRASISTRGTIADGGWVAVPIVVPEGTQRATFELSWKRDWSRTPTNDVDVYVFDPNGKEVLAYSPDYDAWYSPGASLNAPERIVAPAPIPGEYTLYVNGYTVFGDHPERPAAAKTDDFEVKVYLE